MKKVVLFFLASFSMQLLAADITVTQTAEQLAETYGWTSGGFYDSFVLDGVVTYRANQPVSGNKNGYYSPDDPRDWRIYQARNSGEFTVSARAGYKIKSLSFIYGTKNTGVLSLVSGTNVETQYQVASGQTLLVDTNSITFYAGNTTTITNGQVKLSQFTVTYYATDTAAVIERFSKVDQTKNNEQEVTWQGDYADWQVLNARRNVKDTLNGGVQASWCKGGGYFKTMAQGGIKRLSFEWRQFVTDSVELVLAMVADTMWQDTARIQAIPQQAASKNQYYEASISCKQDVSLSFMNLSTVLDKDRFLLGDLYITPYIYIARDNRSFSLAQAEGSFDIATILQDNTDGEGEVKYTILSDATGGATISGSVVDFSMAATSGDILVQAFWNDSLVTTAPVTLHIFVLEPEDDVFIETFSRCTKTKQTGTTYVLGDEGVFGWNMSNFTRQAADTILGVQGTRIGYSGGVVMNGVQEGGIKSISFPWRAASATQPVHFMVSVDGDSYDVKSTAAQSKGETQVYKSAFNIDYNTAMAVTLGAKESTAQAEIILGPVSIAPYLLFRTKLDTVRLEEVATYSLDSAVINNTDTLPVFSILSDETGAAVLNNGVLDLSAVIASGKVMVQATWGQVTTTMSVMAYYAPTDLFTPSCLNGGEAAKFFKDGRLLILRNGRIYNVQGSLFE